MSVGDSVKVCVVGATGYAGVEVVRLVLGHPHMELTVATDRKAAGSPLSAFYPALTGVCDMTLSQPDPDLIAERADVAFLAVPHTASLALTPQLLERGVSVFDLSADYRLSDADVYEAWYGTPHTSAYLLEQAVYGLPEVGRDSLCELALKHASGKPTLVAVPGCYPTASALAALPILEVGVATSSLVIADCISGVSGAGRSPSPKNLYCHSNESLEAYGVASHRHTPEIEQTLTRASGMPIDVVFTPHLAPLSRGLLATVYVEVGAECTQDYLQQIYENRYANEPLVSMLGAGEMPTTLAVGGTARAQVGVALDNRRKTVAIASCAIDNLGKGAAGQAVQCANLVLGFAETAGLDFVAPVV